MSAKVIAVDELATSRMLAACSSAIPKLPQGDALPFLSDNTAWGSLPSRRWPFCGLLDRLACEMASVTRTSASSATTPTYTALRLRIACA